jgi:hypothetical protein
MWLVLGMPAWLAANPLRIVLLQLPGASALLWHPDWMHCKNLGSDKEFYGSILAYMCFHMVAGDPATLLMGIWIGIHRWYIDHGSVCKFSSMRLGMFFKGHDKFAELRGRAAELRGFGQPLLHVFLTYAIAGNAAHDWMINALRACNRMEQIYHDDRYIHADRLPRALAAELDGCCVQFTRNVAGLRRHFRGLNILLFKVTTKFHFLREITLLSEFVHPRMGACWSGEDMMHHMQRLIQSTLAGTKLTNVQAKAMYKYACALGHAIEQSERGVDIRYV